jgi:hypothetical protein
MYSTARIIVRQTSKDVTQPTQNEHLDTCIGDYACNNRFIKHGGIKQLLKQNPKKAKVGAPSRKDRHQPYHKHPKEVCK